MKRAACLARRFSLAKNGLISYSPRKTNLPLPPVSTCSVSTGTEASCPCFTQHLRKPFKCRSSKLTVKGEMFLSRRFLTSIIHGKGFGIQAIKARTRVPMHQGRFRHSTPPKGLNALYCRQNQILAFSSVTQPTATICERIVGIYE